MKSLKISNTHIFVFLCFLYLFIYLFQLYKGIYHPTHINLWNYSLFNNLYENDIFLKQNIFTKTSIIFKVFKTLKINIFNDYVGLILFLICSSASGYFLYLILKDFFKLTKIDSLIILLTMLTVDANFLIDTNISTWVTQHTGTTTQFARPFIFIFIYLTLKKKYLIQIVIAPLMLLVAIKPTYFVIIISILYSLFFYENKKKLWILSPIIVFIFLAFLNLNSNFNLSFDQKIIISQDILIREMEEASFHEQKILNNFLLIISFIISFFLIKKIKNIELYKFIKITIFMSILLYLWGIVYHTYGFKIFPSPKLLSLAPTRAIAIFELFFLLLIINFLLCSKIKEFSKKLLLATIFNLLLGTKGIYISLIILLFWLIIFLLKKNILIEKKIFCNFIFLFFLLPKLIWSTTKVLNEDFDFYALKTLNKWKMNSLYNQKEKLDISIKLKKCRDFILYDPDSKDGMINAIALKSTFIDYSDGGINIFDLNLKKLIHERKVISENIKEKMISKTKLDQEIIDYLNKKNVLIIYEKKFNQTFINSTKVFDTVNFEISTYSKINLNNCLIR